MMDKIVFELKAIQVLFRDFSSTLAQCHNSPIITIITSYSTWFSEFPEWKFLAFVSHVSNRTLIGLNKTTIDI